MHSKKYVFLLLITFTAGCSGVGNLIKERREAKEQAYISKAQDNCRRYGFVENTDTFSKCVQEDVNAAKVRDRPINTSCSKTMTGMHCTTQ